MSMVAMTLDILCSNCLDIKELNIMSTGVLPGEYAPAVSELHLMFSLDGPLGQFSL